MKAYGYGVAGLKYDGGDHPRREEGVPRYVRIAALKGERDRIGSRRRFGLGVVWFGRQGVSPFICAGVGGEDVCGWDRDL